MLLKLLKKQHLVRDCNYKQHISKEKVKSKLSNFLKSKISTFQNLFPKNFQTSKSEMQLKVS